MKKNARNDFNITTKGLDILQTFIYCNIFIIVLLVIGFSCYAITSNTNLMSIIPVILIGFVVALPSIILLCLIQMFIDYMYNIQEQSKMINSLEVTSKNILKEIQVINSYSNEINKQKVVNDYEN